MNHDSSQSNSISCVMGRFVTMTENHVACDYPRARMIILPGLLGVQVGANKMLELSKSYGYKRRVHYDWVTQLLYQLLKDSQNTKI